MQSGSGRAIQTKAVKATRLCWRLPFMPCGQKSGSLWMASEPLRMGTFTVFPAIGRVWFCCFQRSIGHSNEYISQPLQSYIPKASIFLSLHFLSWEWLYHSPTPSGRNLSLAICHLLLSLPSSVSFEKHLPSLSALWLPVLVSPRGTRSLWLCCLSCRSAFHVVTFLCPNLKHVSSSSTMNPCYLLGDVQTLHETLLSCRSVWFCLSAVAHKHFPYTAPLKCTESLLCVGSCAGRHSYVISLTPRTTWSIFLSVLWLLPGTTSLQLWVSPYNPCLLEHNTFTQTVYWTYWIWSLTFSLRSWVTLCILCSLSMPQFPHLYE